MKYYMNLIPDSSKKYDIISCEEEDLFKDDDQFCELDENLALIVAKLNKLGFTTRNCCEGHYKFGNTDVEYLNISGLSVIRSSETYIEFENGIQLPYLPHNYKEVVCTTGYDYKEDKEIEGEWHVLYANDMSNVSTPEEFYKIKLARITDLLEWVNDLEHFVKRI